MCVRKEFTFTAIFFAERYNITILKSVLQNFDKMNYNTPRKHYIPVSPRSNSIQAHWKAR